MNSVVRRWSNSPAGHAEGLWHAVILAFGDRDIFAVPDAAYHIASPSVGAITWRVPEFGGSLEQVPQVKPSDRSASSHDLSLQTDHPGSISTNSADDIPCQEIADRHPWSPGHQTRYSPATSTGAGESGVVSPPAAH